MDKTHKINRINLLILWKIKSVITCCNQLLMELTRAVRRLSVIFSLKSFEFRKQTTLSVSTAKLSF